MPSFRWPDVANAVALGTEVTSHRPQKPANWDTNSQYTKQSVLDYREVSSVEREGNSQSKISRTSSSLYEEESELLSSYCMISKICTFEIVPVF